MSVVLVADLFVVVVGGERGRKGFAESTGRGGLAAAVPGNHNDDHAKGTRLSSPFQQ